MADNSSLNEYLSSDEYKINESNYNENPRDLASDTFEVDNINNFQHQSEILDDAKPSNAVWVNVEDSGTSDSISNLSDLWLPNYGVAEYINERSNWQKQLYSITGEPGFFYFKIFFKFKTNYGLLGGIMHDVEGIYRSTNTAVSYLYSIKKLYAIENIEDRIIALYKFVGTLSYINCEAPWFFKGINGLNALQTKPTSSTKGKSGTIELVCSEDAVDMRLGTLFDLYKYACFDSINCKEIIPDNLRKFDMSIMLFTVPIKYYQTAIMASKSAIQVGRNEGTILNKALKALTGQSTCFKYKTTNYDASYGGFSNMMSFKMFTLQNCEFDYAGLNGYIPNQLDNSTAFNTGKNTIKIYFDSFTEARMNEWNEFMFGDNGFYYNETMPEYIIGKLNDYIRNKSTDNVHNKRVDMISKGLANMQCDESSKQYKGLIDYTESIIRSGMQDYTMAELYPETYGNLYGKFNDYNTEYQKNKIKWLKQGSFNNANLYEYNLGPGSQYFADKLHKLKTNKPEIITVDKSDTKMYSVKPEAYQERDILQYGLNGNTHSSNSSGNWLTNTLNTLSRISNGLYY